MKNKLKIVTFPDDLQEGLFGQVFLWVFEVLPYLDERGIRPTWAIRSKLYGNPEDDFIVIPGLVEITDEINDINEEPSEMSLDELRKLGAVTLGNDWSYANRLWTKFFRIPSRIIERADQFPMLEGALGLHYRGTDKNTTLDETNYVSEEDFISLADDFIQTHPETQIIFIASDEGLFIEAIRSRYPNHRIVSSGEVTHHKEMDKQDNMKKGEHALLDCLLLSRCKYLLKCQSALSGFAKVLNPDIEAYRVSAFKLAYWNPDVPYFPDAHIPKYTSENLECSNILKKLFAGDWTENRAVARRFAKPIRYDHRGRRRRLLHQINRVFLGRFVRK